MITPYDTLEGITEAAATLEGLNKLSTERFQAGYERRERMEEWLVVGGRVFFDTCGNTGIIDDPPEAARGTICIPARGIRWSARMTKLDVPSPGSRCSVCNRGWTIADWFDCKAVRAADVAAWNTPWAVGLTFAEAQEKLAGAFPGSLLRLSTEVRNPADVDTTLVEGRTFPKNPGGYRVVQPTDKIRVGDDVHVYRWDYFHPACLKVKRHTEAFQEFVDIFKAAGVPVMSIVPVKNEYWGNTYGESTDPTPPWFTVKTSFGELTIGWRKRVIEIRWPEAIVVSAFATEEVTKGDNYIHAWGHEKCVEYLRAINEAARR